jgi:hypothetical protein
MRWKQITARVSGGRLVIGSVGTAVLVISVVVALWARAARSRPPDFGWVLEDDDVVADG